jgi:hypothetical protein
MAAVAEQGGSASGVAVVAGQQLRGVEVGAKLAGVGGYAPQKAPGAAATSTFTLIINVPGGTSTTITAPIEPIDSAAEDADNPGESA